MGVTCAAAVSFGLLFSPCHKRPMNALKGHTSVIIFERQAEASLGPRLEHVHTASQLQISLKRGKTNSVFATREIHFSTFGESFCSIPSF